MENSADVGAGNTGAAESADAVPPVSTTQTTQRAQTQNQPGSPNASTVDDDPEWEIAPGKKAKRSQILKQQEAFKKGMYSSQERAAAVTKKFEALTGALTKFGLTAEEFLQDPDAHMSRAAQALVARQVDESMMDPKELELQRREQAIAAREAENKKADETKAQQEREHRAEARAEQIAQEMAPALKASGLPANPKTVARMAEVMSQAYRKGIKLDPSEAASYVAEQIRQEQNWHLDQHQDAQALVDMLGPNRIEMVRQYLIQQSRKPQSNQPTQRAQPSEQPRDERTKRYMGWEEYTRQKGR